MRDSLSQLCDLVLLFVSVKCSRVCRSSSKTLRLVFWLSG